MLGGRLIVASIAEKLEGWGLLSFAVGYLHGVFADHPQKVVGLRKR
jgi:hypothetical protein